MEAEKGNMMATTTITKPTRVRTETKKMESEEEVLAVVNMEFPLLMEYCRDAIDSMAERK